MCLTISAPFKGPVCDVSKKKKKQSALVTNVNMHTLYIGVDMQQVNSACTKAHLARTSLEEAPLYPDWTKTLPPKAKTETIPSGSLGN